MCDMLMALASLGARAEDGHGTTSSLRLSAERTKTDVKADRTGSTLVGVFGTRHLFIHSFIHSCEGNAMKPLPCAGTVQTDRGGGQREELSGGN